VAYTTIPWVQCQFFDDNGDPLSGGFLYSYAPGTTTKQSTYSDAAGTPNSNPITLDAAGRATIFLAPTPYKFVLAAATDTTDPPTTPLWTRDEVAAVAPLDAYLDISGTAGETLVAGDCAYLSAGTGGKTAGRWYKTDANNTYSSTIPPAIGFVTVGGAAGAACSLRKAGQIENLSSLNEGSVYYCSETAGAITATPPTNARPVGVADTTTTLVMAVLPPSATATVAGLVDTAAQSFAGVKTFAAGPVFSTEPAQTISGVSGLFPVALQAGYSGGSTTTPSFTVTAGTLSANGDALLCEWESDYSSATLSARITIGGTNSDCGYGSGNTARCNARATITRISATSVNIRVEVLQDTYVTTSQGTQAVSDLAANTLAITMGMASGTYTLRRYRILYQGAL